MRNNLARQAFALRARFPDAATKLTPTLLTWRGTLQPNELSRVYTVRITLINGGYPKVYVLDPVLDGRPANRSHTDSATTPSVFT